MKFPKSRLDEMQEMKTAKINTIGLYLITAALSISLMVQIILYAEPRQYLAEYLIMMGFFLYIISSNLIIGVWDKFVRSCIRNYLIMSLLSGCLAAIYVCVIAHIYGPLYGYLPDVLLTAGLTFCLCFLFYVLLGEIYHRRRKKLDHGEAYQLLAQKVGVTPQTLKAIENGSYNPSIRLCRKICQATGKTLDELFLDDTPNILN